MKVCGRPTCPCHKDPNARHGPYYEWGRMKAGRLVHTMLSTEQARLVAAAIANYRIIRRLLRAWERESMRAVQAQTDLSLEKLRG